MKTLAHLQVGGKVCLILSLSSHGGGGRGGSGNMSQLEICRRFSSQDKCRLDKILVSPSQSHERTERVLMFYYKSWHCLHSKC
jgi:hypothetical protein